MLVCLMGFVGGFVFASAELVVGCVVVACRFTWFVDCFVVWIWCFLCCFMCWLLRGGCRWVVAGCWLVFSDWFWLVACCFVYAS